MPSRAKNWLKQAERDLEQARSSQRDARHEWACFAAQQSVENAVKALHYARGDWGVGSDVDLVAVVAAAESPFEHRALEWDLTLAFCAHVA